MELLLTCCFNSTVSKHPNRRHLRGTCINCLIVIRPRILSKYLLTSLCCLAIDPRTWLGLFTVLQLLNWRESLSLATLPVLQSQPCKAADSLAQVSPHLPQLDANNTSPAFLLLEVRITMPQLSCGDC
jgi:hypothetical protein